MAQEQDQQRGLLVQGKAPGPGRPCCVQGLLSRTQCLVMSCSVPHMLVECACKRLLHTGSCALGMLWCKSRASSFSCWCKAKHLVLGAPAALRVC